GIRSEPASGHPERARAGRARPRRRPATNRRSSAARRETPRRPHAARAARGAQPPSARRDEWSLFRHGPARHTCAFPEYARLGEEVGATNPARPKGSGAALSRGLAFTQRLEEFLAA